MPLMRPPPFFAAVPSTCGIIFFPTFTIWYNYYTGQAHRGGRYVLADAPLGQIPLFAKAGAAIPVAVGAPQCVEEITAMAWEVFPGQGRYVHYTDDGESMAYKDGAIHKLAIRVQGHTATQTVTQDGYAAPDALPLNWKG